MAFTTSKYFPVNLRLVFGTLIFFLPDKYCPVTESSTFAISSAVPCAITFPPCTPAPGPMSITSSAEYIVSVSCSTTITEFPRSLSFFSVCISFSLSLWCKPILGSSSMYITPTRLDPIWVASLMRWLSPPERVAEALAMVR